MDARKNSWLSRMGIVILAAVLMELISIAQYERIRKVMQEEMTIRSRVVMGSRANLIQHTLDITEAGESVRYQAQHGASGLPFSCHGPSD